MEEMNAMNLKAKVRNIAKTKDISAQVYCRATFSNGFFTGCQGRNYREKFILKGGLLIATMTGITWRPLHKQ